MAGRRWVIGAVLAVAVAQTGCVTCCAKTYKKSLEHGADCELPVACRNQVYVFLVNGVTPPVHGGLGELRNKLAENGFAKVGIADLAGGLCVEHEIKKIRACEPDARFVLVGYDVGAPVATCAARDLASRGARVEALVLLDPVGCKEVSGVPTLLITSGSGTGTTAHGQRVIVPDAGHFGLPAHPTAVAAIVDLLHGIAASCMEPITDPVPEWSYKHAPEMRPPATGRVSEEWSFLADGGTPHPIGTRTAAQPAPAAPSTAAGPVLLRK
ncbi:MAG: hypothetical protein J0I06_12260 [Planctomycetes bacterium]|nr:hypothetical protein [Planctomycetota bacterium]